MPTLAHMTDELTPSEPLGDQDLTRKDTSYSPGSERETEAKQEETEGADAVPPGTGGPDDSGDLDTEPHELHPPNDGGAH